MVVSEREAVSSWLMLVVPYDSDSVCWSRCGLAVKKSGL